MAEGSIELSQVSEVLDELRAEVRGLRARVDDLEAENGALRRARPAVATAPAPIAIQAPSAIGRRRLLVGGATAAAAAAAAVVASATPAAAANGDALILGTDNTATAVTSLSTPTLSLKVSTTGEFGTGLLGLAALTGTAVAGEAFNGLGVRASSVNGTGVYAHGPTALQLHTYAGRPAPTEDDGLHNQGEVVIDSPGNNVWLCVAQGTPGTWRKIGGPATAGQLHLLTNPSRAYDSRSAGGALAPNASRSIPLASKLVAGSTGALLSISVFDTNGSGTIRLGAGGTTPATTAIQWARTGDKATSSATTAIAPSLDAAVKSVSSTGTTHFTIDVVGYYR